MAVSSDSITDLLKANSQTKLNQIEFSLPLSFQNYSFWCFSCLSILYIYICIYIYIYICFEHSGDISYSLLVNPSHTDESWEGWSTCLCIYIYIHIHILHFINIIILLKNLQRANSCSKPVITIVQKLSWSSTCVTIFEFVSFGFVSSCFYLQDFYKAFYKKSKEKSPITSGSEQPPEVS